MPDATSLTPQRKKICPDHRAGRSLYFYGDRSSRGELIALPDSVFHRGRSALPMHRDQRDEPGKIVVWPTPRAPQVFDLNTTDARRVQPLPPCAGMNFSMATAASMRGSAAGLAQTRLPELHHERVGDLGDDVRNRDVQLRAHLRVIRQFGRERCQLHECAAGERFDFREGYHFGRVCHGSIPFRAPRRAWHISPRALAAS